MFKFKYNFEGSHTLYRTVDGMDIGVFQIAYQDGWVAKNTVWHSVYGFVFNFLGKGGG